MRRALAILLLASCSFGSDPNIAVPSDCTGLPDGTRCTDHSLCTSGDACRDGACVPAESIICSASGTCRAAGTCDPLTGLCSDASAIDGTPCDDLDRCTLSDACESGSCRGVEIHCSARGACHLEGTCDPATGACSDPIAPDGTRCEEGDLCTARDECSGGTCLAGEPIDCEQSQCIIGACDPSTGICSGTPIGEGTPCDDLSVCTVDDACASGGCIGDPIPCEASDNCLVATCDAELGCTIERRGNDEPCDDGDACTENEVCTDGACGGGQQIECVEPDTCHLAGFCDSAVGCIHPERPDGALCSDGTFCTFNDTCADGVCIGTPVVCVAPSQCLLAGTCNPVSGICSTVRRADGSDCDDGNQCTNVDECALGVCVGSDPIVFGGALCQDGVCFRDVAASSGVTFTSTDSGTTYIGAGGGFLDYDGDGWLDVIAGSESARPSLYRNLGDGSFQDVTAASGLPRFFLPDRFMGFAAADYDNDGDPDLYLLAWGMNRLMRNDGGTFTDVTQAAGVGDPSWSASAAFGDYDGDGDLDLYVANYIAVSNFPNHTGAANKLYANDGDGTFTDIGAQLGVEGAGTSLAATWSDFDGDRDLDLFVCNDFGSTVEPNRIYRNDGGTFTDVAAQLGADLMIYCMGIAPGDWDRDGDLDYYFTNIDRNVLLENRGASGFVDVAPSTGTELEYDRCFTGLYTTSWGAGFHDFDCDGFLDLYVSTGYIPAATHIANALSTPKAFFKNDGQGAFLDVRDSAGVADTRIGRGVAFADWDRDGDMDVLQVNLSGAPRLYRNDSPATGSYLEVEAVGRLSARDAIGARVIADVGPVRFVREVNPNYSLESASQLAVHFGLGAAASVDVLEIRYLSGADQTFFDVPTDMALIAIEPRVVISRTMVSPAAVAPGGSFELTFVLSDLANVAVPIDWNVRIGTQPGPTGTRTVSANGEQTVTLTLTAPAASGTVPLFVTIGDAAGAVDQSRVSLVVN
jgi:hypothetical protein